MTDLGSVLMDAATIMVTGMVVVFVFLSILIFLVQLLAKIAPPDPESAAVTTTVATPAKVDTSLQGGKPEVIAAISAAVTQYRQRRA
ncbi:oxaloacetate decarboxylase subunit gamma [Photobacterium jeanii]|uniref:Probable oxaloacetate decarboxylase gamma chain n=1 Tax=Photobacterium jeanii TaxID=858640 RepID=A0A178KJK7_9GAMM|nr:oxaloacetate decarboxylase subunit gamma [Photobacterium jeanii]OAN17479.1 oxaloacetate decarboxylase subunit gamma [Photobacterium jeanii]PST86175.1 oxaloacetate decarboxylase subunit gamma [Photobacterium jeanii]